jgi:4-alpha-glucanotransferase
VKRRDRRDPRAWGVELGYRDFREVYRKSPSSTVTAILDAMGADDGPPPPSSTRVVTQGEAFDLADARAIRFEDGGEEEIAALPDLLPLGYHSLVGRDDSESRLVVAPRTCFLPRDLRTWGWAVQLYALRSEKSWGIGDLGDLERLGTWAAASGAGVLLVNPLHANKPGPQQPSPYHPSSRCFHDPLYLDLSSVAERPDALDEVNSSPLIERDRIYALKLDALKRAWNDFAGHEELDSFVASRAPLLEDYATFNTLAEAFGPSWTEWPDEYRRPRSPTVARWREAKRERVGFWCWVQWLLSNQIREASQTIGLIHDLAVGVHPEGADAWIWQDLLRPQMHVGAPPDRFNSRGQDWLLPPFDPHALRAANYDPFIATLRAAFTNGAGVRIDHVMGLFRLYWIPEGVAPTEGAYVRYPHRDLLSILALESQRARSFVVGEDLGTVEPIVREEMSQRDMLSYRILWFERKPPRHYPRRALAAITDHDLPTIAGMWTGADLAEQEALGLEPDLEAHREVRERVVAATGLSEDAPTDEVIARLHEVLAESPSAVVVATLEDALAVTSRPNLPGTTDERPNWSIPLPMQLQDIERHPRARAIASKLSIGRDRQFP